MKSQTLNEDSGRSFRLFCRPLIEFPYSKSLPRPESTTPRFPLRFNTARNKDGWQQTSNRGKN